MSLSLNGRFYTSIEKRDARKNVCAKNTTLVIDNRPLITTATHRIPEQTSMWMNNRMHMRKIHDSVANQPKKEIIFIKSSGILCDRHQFKVCQFSQNSHHRFGLRWLLRKDIAIPYYNYLKGIRTHIVLNLTHNPKLYHVLHCIPDYSMI